MKIYINDEKYRYDVYHIFELFYSFTQMEFEFENPNDCDYKLNVSEDELLIENKEGEQLKFNLKSKMKFKHEFRKSMFKYLREKTLKELPWGILIGIRPTKIVLDMMDDDFTEDEIIDVLMNEYFARIDKAKLCIDIAKAEKARVNKESKNISIYIGMPFCPTTCLYCSFASNPISGRNTGKMVEPYLEKLKEEIDIIKKFINKKGLNIECVYFGGGTPTSVNNDQFESIIKKVYKSFVENRNVKEFNIECGRPDSINEEKLLTMKKYKVSRISINPQTMNEDTLKLIGRHHTVEDIIKKFNLARKLGFDNINMDIIVGLPNETINHIENTCREILKLNPDSLTVHGMSIKRGSKLYEEIYIDKVRIMKQQSLNEMYMRTAKLAKELNMNPYYMYRQKNMVGHMENVGYCKAGKEGLYNIEMIEDKQTIIALGADAVTKLVNLKNNKIERFGNLKDVKEYITRFDEKIKGKIELLETIY
ncbi:coproporphyrinogen III oxidase [Clostridium novyi]|uniref:coproporphyrinogen III oxidase n=1 Tax=Clostridium novyi TaxID=1542 RepID=UPI0004D555F0|nr:coproporphyrinogen III oxidase [Clostridium novyi]KEI13045.1 coproporphyrinogen III oxidase [Clostridium novyi B str. NCTC 9691]